jgi:hydroxymethylbilane synthase
LKGRRVPAINAEGRARIVRPARWSSVLAHRPLLIGTRGSPLALWQAEHVRSRLAAASGLAPVEIGLEVITTSGDRIREKPLREFGGKGLFTKEIDEALLAGRVDVAVHSMKDLPTELPEGIVVGAVLRRGDVRDAFISGKAASIAELPTGATVGSSSLRRQAQLRRLRPDLNTVEFRGNVETRLLKLEQGIADATLLAFAGLDRLGLTSRVTAIMSTSDILPAVAQGAIGITCRGDDERTRMLLEPVNDETSATAVACERAFLAELDGSCKTPIAGLAEIADGRLRFRGLALKPDGTDWQEITIEGKANDAVALGSAAGRDLAGSASRFLDSLRV